MDRDSWVENLRCPHCRKTGAARVSTADEYSWDVEMNSVPEGFTVIRSGDVSQLLLLFVQLRSGTIGNFLGFESETEQTPFDSCDRITVISDAFSAAWRPKE